MQGDGEKIYVSTKPECTELTIFPKDLAIPFILDYFDLPDLSSTAYIGDTLSDWPIHSREDLGLAIAVGNAKDNYKDKLRSQVPPERLLITDGNTAEGFEVGHAEVIRRGLTHFFIDRDGVVWKGGVIERAADYMGREIRTMGRNGKPLLIILTASSLSQNSGFIPRYGFTADNLADNPAIGPNNSRLVLVRNGGVHYDVLTGKTTNHYRSIVNPDLADLVEGQLRKEITHAVKRILPEFHLEESHEYESQDGACYIVPDEDCNITGNTPRKHTKHPTLGRIEDYRNHKEGKRFASAVREIFFERLSHHKVPHETL
jgi:hypothetical protein